MLALRSVRKRLARSIERDRHSQPRASERLIRLSAFQCLHKRNGRVSRLFVHQLETWDGRAAADFDGERNPDRLGLS
jgi:hypothetical protein